MPQMYHELCRVLKECATTATCAEFIGCDRKGDDGVYAVVRREDVQSYCASKGLLSFPGKRAMTIAFVRSEDGKVVSWENGDIEYDRAVERFRAGRWSLRTL